jgi:hypothetical protein
VRAFLITLAMFIALVAGLPIPNARVREGLAPGLGDFVLAVDRMQSALLAPFAFVRDEFKLIQRWQLFAGANTDRYWIWIEAREKRSGPWLLLYRPHDPAHAFLAADLEYRRVRGAWNPRRGDAQAGYPAFVSWVSARIFRARPEFSQTRVRIEKIRILPGGRGFEGTGEFLHTLTRTRREVLP